MSREGELKDALENCEDGYESLRYQCKEMKKKFNDEIIQIYKTFVIKLDYIIKIEGDEGEIRRIMQKYIDLVEGR